MSTTAVQPHPSVLAAREVPVNADLARDVREVMANLRSGADADACRARLGALRAQHGDSAFRVAQFAAVASVVNR